MKVLLGAVCAAALALAQLTPASAAGPVRRHALSLIGEPKYPADFKHFDYVNPDAPKGGALRLAIYTGSFDTLNVIPLKGEKAAGLGLLYESLMATSLEESSTTYGLIAEWVSYPDDYSSATFGLRREARWQDGTPITPEDVVFSMETFKAENPNLALYYHNVAKVEKTGAREVTFTFDVKGNRELPQIVGEFAILPRHYWTGKDASGAPRDMKRTTLETPLGSGPYRVKSVDVGRSVVYERVPDYWAKDLPIAKGSYNFDEIRYDYFRDSSVAFEAFKAGKIDYWYEGVAKNWATAYEFPAVKKGWIIRRGDIALKNPRGMQAFILNVRRSKFADPRVRQAFDLAFDFEWANQNLFYGQYARATSYFENSELASRGLPQGRELEILESLRGEVPPEVFTTEYKNPVNAGPNDLRNHLREATKLLQEAGWQVKNGVLTNAASGEPMTVEFLVAAGTATVWDRIIQPYVANLAKLGIKATVRAVDEPQYKSRTDDFDYDIIHDRQVQSDSPGNEQRDYWSSASADKPGSRNSIGVKNPAVDKLVDRIIFAKSREELVAATRALDRVLLWNHYVVPQWYSPYDHIAWWDRFGQPATPPARALGVDQVWWFDAERSARLDAARASGE